MAQGGLDPSSIREAGPAQAPGHICAGITGRGKALLGGHDAAFKNPLISSF